MEEITNLYRTLPLPTVLILSGIILVIMSSTKRFILIDIDSKRSQRLFYVGLLVLISGLLFYLVRFLGLNN